MDEERVVIAGILRSRGNKGEVSAVSQTDIPGRLENLKTATVRLTDGRDVPVEVEASWPHKGEWVFKFVGVSSISEAEGFTGSELWIPLADRGELPPGEYFQADLVGCLVREQGTGSEIGVVSGVQNYGASPLLEVEYLGRPVLIPLVDAICPVVDIAGKSILVDLPEGLLDL